VKSSEYFGTDNISLETSVHWLSEKIVTFEADVGCTRNLQKCNSHFMQKSCQVATNSSNLLCNVS